MQRREFITFLGGAAAAWPLAARAQQSDRVRRIGALMQFPANDREGQARAAALVQGLDALDWHEGRNLRIDWRWTGSAAALIERYSAELVSLSPDVIVVYGSLSVAVLRQKTSTIPIVFVIIADPVGQDFVVSLAHPGGNITGFSSYDPPMASKWLGMLMQITPPIARVAILFNPEVTPFAGLMLRNIEDTAPSIAVAVRAAPCHDDAEIDAMMAALAREGRGGVLVLPSAFTTAHRDAIVALAAQHRLPTVYPVRFFATSGGLMSYGFDQRDLFRRAASYVDRILKGEKPAELPVQAPTKFELVINLKTAKALGLTILPTLLATADEVIE
jgi:putative ABC transport system substrate-binding protein